MIEETIHQKDEKSLELAIKTKKQLEQADYNSEEYRLFLHNFLGDPVNKTRDSEKIMHAIGESHIMWHS